VLYREGVGFVGTCASLKSMSMVVFANAHGKDAPADNCLYSRAREDG
jgi:hypothetical protein